MNDDIYSAGFHAWSHSNNIFNLSGSCLFDYNAYKISNTFEALIHTSVTESF